MSKYRPWLIDAVLALCYGSIGVIGVVTYPGWWHGYVMSSLAAGQAVLAFVRWRTD